ncbi:MAG: hypothetical protein IPM23_12390 [Candidatus Melainabacteria bacterium]|nr:hypothetical protein [Candidatus Melainabacteria bacterium]
MSLSRPWALASPDLSEDLIERNELLDDPRFWAILYESFIEATTEDEFDDGCHRFFGCTADEVETLFSSLSSAGDPDSFPVYTVEMRLTGGFSVGLGLSMFPDSFDIPVFLREDADATLIGIIGGAFMLPALRWCELAMLQDRLLLQDANTRSRMLLMLYPCVYLTYEVDVEEVRASLLRALAESGIGATHRDELVARLTECGGNTVWREDPQLGWVNDSRHSLRNPEVDYSEGAIASSRRLFAREGR